MDIPGLHTTVVEACEPKVADAAAVRVFRLLTTAGLAGRGTVFDIFGITAVGWGRVSEGVCPAAARGRRTVVAQSAAVNNDIDTAPAAFNAAEGDRVDFSCGDIPELVLAVSRRSHTCDTNTHYAGNRSGSAGFIRKRCFGVRAVRAVGGGFECRAYAIIGANAPVGPEIAVGIGGDGPRLVFLAGAGGAVGMEHDQRHRIVAGEATASERGGAAGRIIGLVRSERRGQGRIATGQRGYKRGDGCDDVITNLRSDLRSCWHSFPFLPLV